MSDDFGPLPILPNSELDDAIDNLVRNIMAGETPSLTAFKTVELANPTHMLALGTRIWCWKAGLKNPKNLVSPIYRQWYGHLGGCEPEQAVPQLEAPPTES